MTACVPEEPEEIEPRARQGTSSRACGGGTTHLLQTFAVPQYSSRSRLHGAIARLSRFAPARSTPAGTATVQAQLDEAVGRLPGFNTVPDEDLP